MRSPVSVDNSEENRMKEYTEYTDEELVELLRQGDTEVMDYPVSYTHLTLPTT